MATTKAKAKAQGIGCLNNTKQLLLAWNMYAGDNNDVLAPNEFPYLTSFQTYAQQDKMRNWVVGTHGGCGQLGCGGGCAG